MSTWKQVKVWQVYDANGEKQGYYLFTEQRLAEIRAEEIGGSYKLELITVPR